MPPTCCTGEIRKRRQLLPAEPWQWCPSPRLCRASLRNGKGRSGCICKPKRKSKSSPLPSCPREGKENHLPSSSTRPAGMQRARWLQGGRFLAEQEQPQWPCRVGGGSHRAAQHLQPPRCSTSRCRNKAREATPAALGVVSPRPGAGVNRSSLPPSTFPFPPISPHQFPIYLLF